jgi:uncharacterized protein YggE
VKLGPLVSVTEQSFYSPVYYGGGIRAMSDAGGFVSTPVSAGKLTIKALVEVSFAIA